METAGTSPHSEPTLQGDAMGDVSGVPNPHPILAPWWVRIVPFFLSAFFFLSAIFMVFAPLPLLLLRFRSGRRLGWLAVATNAVIVGVAGGGVSLAMYAVFVSILALVMDEMVASRKSLEKTVFFTLLAMAMCGGVILAWYAHLHHVNPIVEVRQELNAMVDFVQKSVTQSNPNASIDVDDWKRNLMIEFPSAIAVFALIMVWANLAILLRLNPLGVREKMGLAAGFLKSWKSPDWMVWPAILSGFFLVVDFGAISNVSLNVFRFLMAIYAIQGLSILSFFFDVWNVRGVFRAFGFLAAIFLMMPLLLSLGFFDLWFDFRSKFRQA